MDYNEQFAKSFKYGLMFGKDVKPGDDVGVSVTDSQDIVLAVKKAYIDMSPRTFRSTWDEKEKKSLDPEKKEALFLELADKIADYMCNGTDDFDTWHHKLCVFFIQRFSVILENAGKDPKGATYGKAQKIVNMTFKYLYCFDDAAKYAERFAPCHMALDSYILNWVNEWYLDEYNEEKPQSQQLSRYGKNHLPFWSHLEYESENEGVPQYVEIQDAIRKKVQREYNRPRIEAEFEIWYIERQKALKKERKP